MEQRRFSPGTAIDIHSHWAAPDWLALLEKEGADNGPTIGKNERGHMTFRVPGYSQVYPETRSDLSVRLQAMDAAGVDMHALSLAMPFVYWAPPAFGVKLSRAYNDSLSAAHLKYPDRFLGLATLPMQDTNLAVQELGRIGTLPGLRGIYIATHILDRNLDDQGFWPVYAKCEELGWPIFLHPGHPIGGERMRNYYLRNFLGNPYDTGIAAASLMFGGVMDAYPKLEVVLPHAGGTFPSLIGRMDHGATVRREVEHLPKPPSSYLRRFHYDTLTHSTEILTNLVRQVGADRVVLGSDTPADMGYKKPVEVVDSLTEVSAQDRDLIRGGNAARLLKIPQAATVH